MRARGGAGKRTMAIWKQRMSAMTAQDGWSCLRVDVHVHKKCHRNSRYQCDAGRMPLKKLFRKSIILINFSFAQTTARLDVRARTCSTQQDWAMEYTII